MLLPTPSSVYFIYSPESNKPTVDNKAPMMVVFLWLHLKLIKSNRDFKLKHNHLFTKKAANGPLPRVRAFMIEFFPKNTRKVMRGGRKHNRNNKNLVMYSTNAAGLKTKVNSLKNFIKDLNVAIFTMQETHFSKTGILKIIILKSLNLSGRNQKEEL